nr:hypothetical protein [Marinicella sp. W31]MDC2877987.1 hypothetical protein [Marinicella sp. W31]
MFLMKNLLVLQVAIYLILRNIHQFTDGVIVMPIFRALVVITITSIGLGAGVGSASADSGTQDCQNTLDPTGNYIGTLVFLDENACSGGLLDPALGVTLVPEWNGQAVASGYTLCSFERSAVSARDNPPETYICQLDHHDISFSKYRVKYGYQDNIDYESYSRVEYFYYLNGRKSNMYKYNTGGRTHINAAYSKNGSYFSIPSVVTAPDGTTSYSQADSMLFGTEVLDYVSGDSASVSVQLLFKILYD